MDPEFFLNALQWVNNDLEKTQLSRVFNSVGSNIFLEFGQFIEIALSSGKKDLRREWIIWIGDSSWRLTKNESYVIGSGESPEVNLTSDLEKLLGKSIVSVHIISHFLDVEFHFEDGSKLITFFNWMGTYQWTLFLPNKTELVIDGSTKESIQSLQHLSKQVEVKDKYKTLDIPLPDAIINEISFNENEVSKFICANSFSIDLGLSAWRLEKNDEYYVGRLDYYFGCQEGQEKEFKSKLSELVGKKIKHIGIDSSGMDARFQFDEGYTLELFTHSSLDPWKVSYKGELLLPAKHGDS